jgi:hypothetical protein
MRPLAVLVAAVALLLPACGGGDDEADSVSTVTTTVTTTVTSTVTATTTTAPEPLSSRTFQLPPKQIGCLLANRLLRCDILPGLQPEPNASCDFDWVGVELGTTGPAAPNCGSDTVFDQSAPTLAPGDTWTRSGIECEALRNSLHCTNPEGHEFDLGPGSWSVS